MRLFFCPLVASEANLGVRIRPWNLEVAPKLRCNPGLHRNWASHPLSTDFKPDQHYQQVVQQLAGRIRRWHASGAQVIGLNGAQGTGKSTLAGWLALALEGAGLRVGRLSLDDLYLGRSERAGLAQKVHPLLATRGVPGTHDVELGLRTIRGLLQSSTIQIPRFVKAIDDRAPETEWPVTKGPVDLVLFEGWCLGLSPEQEDASPLNALEAEHDADGQWRAYIEAQLAGPYQSLFGQLDRLIYLAVPSFEQVLVWRRQQELGNAAQVPGARPMSDAELGVFISHYERLTRRAMRQMPARADLSLPLDADHRFGDLGEWQDGAAVQ